MAKAKVTEEEMVELAEMLEFVNDHGDKLQGSQIRFIQSCNDWSGPLTIKMAEWLKSIHKAIRKQVDGAGPEK